MEKVQTNEQGAIEYTSCLLVLDIEAFLPHPC